MATYYRSATRGASVFQGHLVSEVFFWPHWWRKLLSYLSLEKVSISAKKGILHKLPGKCREINKCWNQTIWGLGKKIVFSRFVLASRNGEGIWPATIAFSGNSNYKCQRHQETKQHAKHRIPGYPILKKARDRINQMVQNTLNLMEVFLGSNSSKFTVGSEAMYRAILKKCHVWWWHFATGRWNWCAQGSCSYDFLKLPRY